MVDAEGWAANPCDVQPRQAARIAARKSSTSRRTFSDWVASSDEAIITCCAADPVSLDNACTCATLIDTSWVPRAASEALRAISLVAAVCCTTVAAIEAVMSLTETMGRPICWIAPSAWVEADWIAAT